ncbi:MAG: hypothetical protein A2942_03045 [Candidatus Lloydbacteria bacterium RIFCSPLOWO2_01_FULL_50_20]|uniref:Glycosyltransferase RgtA/B/C/D-like domain-containing protein n=1 Tax=Candidatus Lloydbacteria bacterium RIFCSPLOWO2_01_FULL_50_20 TaxID=1798665 RepID=A0A1G2DGS9_9BACT|nr:MAG: hypothetical protein A2942_03045 [Candidatus Lloydbacteria bacterium RIFCSPLOWO2_01_FULL_50_20]
MIKNWFAADSPHIRFLCVILLVAALNIFVRLSFLPLTAPTLGDGPGYLNNARIISGEPATPFPGRLLKPLTPLGIALFAPLFHGDMVSGFVMLNVLCYILFALAAYVLLLLFTADRFLAMLVTLMFISTYPILEYGLNLESDMGSWLLFVLTIFGSVRYYRAASWKNFGIAVAAVVVGLLWKEYAIPAGIFLGLVVLFEPTQTWKEKFFRIFVLAAFSALAVGIMQWIIYAKYHYTYIDFFREAASTSPSQSQRHLYFIGKSLFAVFLLGWGLVLAGLLRWRSIPRSDQHILALLFPPSMMFLLWTSVSSRLYYIVAPLLAILALHGLRSLTERRLVQVCIVVAIMVGSYAWLFASGTFRIFFQ